MFLSTSASIYKHAFLKDEANLSKTSQILFIPLVVFKYIMKNSYLKANNTISQYQAGVCVMSIARRNTSA